MLARAGKLPTGRGWSYEVKWDGLRAIVSTEGQLSVRSGRGWNITDRCGFLAGVLVPVVVDGELVVFDSDGKPDFPLLCEAVFHRRSPVPLTFIAFDVLSIEGASVTHEPYRERRRLLASLELEGPQVRTPEAFDEGEALWQAVCDQELEGVVAKRLNQRYLSGERAWLKINNRDYRRYELQ